MAADRASSQTLLATHFRLLLHRAGKKPAPGLQPPKITSRRYIKAHPRLFFVLVLAHACLFWQAGRASFGWAAFREERWLQPVSACPQSIATD